MLNCQDIAKLYTEVTGIEVTEYDSNVKSFFSYTNNPYGDYLTLE